MGRRLGTWNLSEEQIRMIIDMTQKSKSRREIARTIPCSTSTVYKFQKRFNLI